MFHYRDRTVRERQGVPRARQAKKRNPTRILPILARAGLPNQASGFKHPFSFARALLYARHRAPSDTAVPARTPTASGRHTHNQLAEVAPLQQADEGVGRRF